MKQNRLLSILTLLVFVVACGKESKERTSDENVKTIDVVNTCSKESKERTSDEKVKTINFTDLEYKEFAIRQENIEFISLEVTENSLVGDIEKIVIRDSLLFVLDKNNNLSVFNLEGKFLNRIGHIGQGPNELYHLSHFYVNARKKEVGIFDVIQRKVHFYNYKGNWQRKINVGDCLSEIVNKMYCLPNGTVLTTMRNQLGDYESDFNFCLFSVGDNCLKLASYCPFGFKPDRNITVGWSQVGENGKNVFLNPNLSDSIYVLNNTGKIAGKYIFKSELKSVDTFEKRADFRDSFEAKGILKNEGYSTGFLGLYATDKFLIFAFPNYKDSKYYHILWDLEKDEGYRTYHSVLPYGITSGIGIYTTYKNKFVTSFQAPQLLELQKSPYAIKGHKQLDKIMSTLTEEDNPIIVLYELE